MPRNQTLPADQDRPRSRRLRPLLQLLGFARPYAGRWLIAALALTIGAGGVLAFGSVIQTVVDSGLSTGSMAALNQALYWFLAVVSITAIAIFVRSYLLNWLGERIVADIRKQVFNHVLNLDIAFFETTRVGEIISRLNSDTALLQMVVGSTLAMALRTGLLIIGGGVMLLLTSPALTSLVVLAIPLVVGPTWLLGHRVRRLSRASQDRVADLGSFVDEVIHGIRTVQAFCHEPLDRRHYAAQVETAFSTALRRSLASAALSSLAIFITAGAVGLALWVGGREVLAGRLSGGELSAFLFYAIVVAGAVGSFSELAGQLLRGAGAAERLLELLRTPVQVKPPEHPVHLRSPVTGRVAFEQVNFAYPARSDQPALQAIDFTVAPGERIALVGPSGAGKSTIFQLLMRFYEPHSGTVRFDGADTRQLEPRELRQHIALVPQDPVIFATSAWDNIRYGLTTADAEAVHEAAEAAHVTDFIQRLPEGFQTFLGERGVRLSGGERQRIAIARALLRDPALLLLDEATSALDAHSEQLVQAALQRLMAERTSIVIAHRLATVRHADRIIVIDQGRIVATGTHDALIAAGGLYAHLAELQFQEPAVNAAA